MLNLKIRGRQKSSALLILANKLASCLSCLFVGVHACKTEKCLDKCFLDFRNEKNYFTNVINFFCKINTP